MYFVYILKSLSSGRYYIGSTKNVQLRLKQHNKGKSTWTRKYSPWKIIYTEEIITKSEAIKRENEIKRYKGGIAFKQLLYSAGLAE